MGGQAAALGFEYQFLCTLSFALRGLLDSDDWLSGIVIDAPPSDDLQADQEIVDFALMRGDCCELAAQVKGGAPGSTMSAADAARVLLRLLTHDADKYALVTNRRPGPGLIALIEALQGNNPRDEIAALLSRSPEVQRSVLAQDTQWCNRVKRAQIVLHDRSTDELRAGVREQVRMVRRQLDPENAGWDAAGLLTGYLTAEVLAKAASPGAPTLDRAALVAALQIDQRTLRSLVRERNWAVPLTTAPRATDIARPDVLERIALVLSTPVRDDSVPICVLTGLSGIGKTSIAAAWAEDRADAYANILWIDAATSAQIEASFAQAAAQLTGHELGSGQPAPDVVRAALARSALPWLMVFDNAVSLRSVRDWLPSSGIGHVLVTTINPTAVSGPNIRLVAVDAMTREQAIALLAARLLPGRIATAAETDSMYGLAARLQYWPLALELAATYLNDCLGGLRGVSVYESLVMRSLDDEDAMPPGYPRTLVKAIQLAWQRMVDRTTDADRLAVAATRRASLLAPRRIPLHMVLSACLIEPRSLVEDGVERGPRVYEGPEPPLGEVIRAIRRQSLVIEDTPLWDRDGALVPHSAAFTIAINEIVQTILREDLRRLGEFDNALSAIAFHTQYWLSYYVGNDELSVAMALTAHAVCAADHALEEQSQDYCVALLLGNTAQMLVVLEIHELAIHYLRVELEILAHSPQDQSLLRMQTAASLASALFQGASRPREVVDDFADALEECVKHIHVAYETDEQLTARSVSLALNAVVSFINDAKVSTPRIAQLRVALEQYRAMLPVTGRPDLGHEALVIHELIRSSAYDAALQRIDGLLTAAGIFGLERTQLYRLRLECHVWLSDWDTAVGELQPFLKAAAADTIRTTDAATIARNVGFAALHKLNSHNGPSASVLVQAVAVADHCASHGRSMQAHDKVVIDVFRCVCSVLAGEIDNLQQTLAQLDLAELTRQRLDVLDVVLGLLRRWPEYAPRKAASSNVPFSDPVSPATLDEGELFGSIANVPAATRPLMASAIAQAHIGVGPTADGHLADAYDLACVLKLMGFPAEVVGTACTLRAADRPETVVYERNPHYVVYSRHFGRLVDPGISSLVSSIDGLPDPPRPTPAVMPLAGLSQLHHGVGLLTHGNVVAVYQEAEPKSTVQAQPYTTSGPTPFLIAMKALFALLVAGDTDALVRMHPNLIDIIPTRADQYHIPGLER